MNRTPRKLRRRLDRRMRAVLAAVSAGAVLAALVVVLVTHRTTGPAEKMTVERLGDQLSMSSPLGTSTVRLEATLRNSATNGGFNLERTLLDGAVVHRTSDDVAPIRTSLGTLGGNHGFSHVAAFTNPDGKTTEDLGSVWTDGARQYELLAIDSEGELVIGGDYTLSDGVVSSARSEPDADLRPVQGAVHRAPIPRRSRAAQLLPSTGAVDVQAACDGSTVASTQQQCQEVVVKESYEVLDYVDLYDQAGKHVGISYSTLDIQGAVRIENVYTFSAGGMMRLQSELSALRPTLLDETGLLQSAPLTGGGDRTVIRQLPGVKPIQGFDFRRGADLSRYRTNLRVTSNDLMRPEQPPTFALDRIVENGQTKIGFAIGYQPVGDQAGSQASRAEAAGTNLWDLRGTGKSYPVVLTERRLNPGDRLTVQGFRAYLTPAQADQIAENVGNDVADGCPTPTVC